MQTEVQIFNAKLWDKCCGGGIWEQWGCFKASDLVKISKVSRRWEGEEEKDCGGRCKGPQWEEALHSGETEASPQGQCAENQHKVLRNTREMDVRLLSAPQSSKQGRQCLGACEVHTPSLSGPMARHRMHGAGNGAGGSFGQFICVIIAV